MNTKQKITTADVIGAIESAQSDWTGWDWTEDFAGADSGDGEPSIVYYSQRPDDCDDRVGADDARQFADRVEKSAQAASELADDAIDALNCGDRRAALSAICAASAIESEYGDCPAYRQARAIMRSFCDSVDE